MNSSNYRDITDELLSAYLDDQVTPQERAHIEAAVAADGMIAWRLDSLRQTVVLLQALPELPLPRSFVLQPQQVSDVVAARRTQRPEESGQSTPVRWTQWRDGWRNFWQAGNPLLRNAAAVSFAVMLALLGGSRLWMAPAASLTSDAGMAAVPASAPAAEAVALAPAATQPAAANGKIAGAEPATAVAQESAPAAKAAAPQTDATEPAEAASAKVANAEPTTAATEEAESAVAVAAAAEEPMTVTADEAAEEPTPAAVEESAPEEVPAEAVPQAAMAAAPAPMPGAPDLLMPPGGVVGGVVGGGDGSGAGGIGAGSAMMGGGPGAPIGGEGGLLPPNARELDPARLPQPPVR